MADATGSVLGQLFAEYILNGKKIKLGTGRAATVADEIYQNLKKWDPKSGQQFDITGNTKNPWSLKLAPLVTYARSKIDSKVWVNDFIFEESPGGLTKNVGENVRGFLALLLSHAKAGSQVRNSESAKELTSIMPRTSFAKMYKLIESKLENKDLWAIVNKLACYINPIEDADEYAAVDESFCSGCPDNTKINGKFEELQINICYGSEECPVNVKAWIQGLEDGKDLLKEADEAMIDGQVGGYGYLTEYRLNHPTEKLALFEFRDLPSCKASSWKSCLEAAEAEIVKYHNQYPGN